VVLHVLAQRPEEATATEALVEVVPVERADGRRIIAVLPAGGQEIEPPAVRKVPLERDRVPVDARELPVPVVRSRRTVKRLVRVVVDQLDDARRRAYL
jgi:hypothetical protein